MERLLVDGGHNVCKGSVGNDAFACDMLIFAGPRGGTDEIVARLGRIDNRTVVVDAMEDTLSAGPDAALVLAGKLGTRGVIRALIALPKAGSNVLMWGDDPSDMKLVAQVFRSSGCMPTDCDPTPNGE
jgi:ABC-type sugar transport system substrate-binding protein